MIEASTRHCGEPYSATKQSCPVLQEWLAEWPCAAVAKRQLLVSLRAKSSFLFLVLLLGACVLAVERFWRFSVGPNGLVLSGDVLDSMVWILGLSSVGLLPGLAAARLSHERHHELYEQLQLTCVRPLGVFAANMLTSLAYYFLLQVALLPFMSIALFSVGVDTRQLLGVVGALLWASALGPMLGTLAGALFRRVALALTAAYVLEAAYWLCFFRVTGANMALEWGDFMNATALAYTGLVAYLSLAVSVMMLSLPTAGASGRSGAERGRKRRALRKRPRLMPDHVNPIFLRDLRIGFLTRGFRSFGMFCGTLLLAGAFLAYVWLDTLRVSPATPLHEMPAVVVVLAIPFLLASVAVLVGNFTRENEMQSFDLLRMTLLRPGQVVAGKIASALLSLAPMLAALVVLFAVALYVEYETWMSPEILYNACILYCVCAWLAACATWSVSLRFSRTAACFVAGCIALAALLLAPLLIPAAFGLLFRGNIKSASSWFEVLSPPAAFLRTYESVRWGTFRSNLPFALSSVGYAAVGVVIAARSVRRYAERLQREED